MTISDKERREKELQQAEAYLNTGSEARNNGELERAQADYQKAENLYRANGKPQGQGNATLALGHIAWQRGLLDEAADYYRQAAHFFQQAGDAIHEADAYRSLADVQRMSRHFSRAEEGYIRAMEAYKAANDVFGETDAQLGLAHVYIDEEQQLDRAEALLADALTSSLSLQYRLGEADANLSLAGINLLRGNIDQALIGAEAAHQLYSEPYNELGLAHANRLLGKIHMRRGHLAYANSLVEHALQTYQALAYQAGQAETMVELGKIQLRRGLPEQALQTFEEARIQARLLDNSQVESRALLGLGDVYYQLGQPGQAFLTYTEAKEHIQEALDEVERALPAAEAEIGLARVALFTGELTDAEHHLTAAAAASVKTPFAAQVATMAALTRGQLLLTENDVTAAEAQFREAHEQAEAQQREAAEATLGLAQTRLARNELDAARETFAATARQFQQIEDVDGDGFATLGIAQVLLQQQQWNESLEYSRTAGLRFNQANDQPGQADALLTQGRAHQGKGELDLAAARFEQALHLYRQQHRPLENAQARAALALVYRVRGELERARNEQTQAITHVELVMHSLTTSQQRSAFLCQYAPLYAQTAITDAQRNQDKQGRALLQHFARLSCGDELAHPLETYEHMLPTLRSKKVSEEKLLAQIHELIGQLDTYEQTLPPEAETVSEQELLAITHELVRLITEYEHAVTTPSEDGTEGKLLSNQMLVERLRQMRRGL